MITLTAHEEPSPRADRVDRAERLEFVKDGFSLIAAYLAPIWLLANRLWLAFAGYAAVVGVLSAATAAFDLSEQWLSLGVMLLHLLIGLEADGLKRWSLDRRGWSMVGTVTGRNRAECERRFFDNWLDGTPALAAASLGRGYAAPAGIAAAVSTGAAGFGHAASGARRFGRWLSPKA